MYFCGTVDCIMNIENLTTKQRKVFNAIYSYDLMPSLVFAAAVIVLELPVGYERKKILGGIFRCILDNYFRYRIVLMKKTIYMSIDINIIKDQGFWDFMTSSLVETVENSYNNGSRERIIHVIKSCIKMFAALQPHISYSVHTKNFMCTISGIVKGVSFENKELMVWAQRKDHKHRPCVSPLGSVIASELVIGGAYFFDFISGQSALIATAATTMLYGLFSWCSSCTSNNTSRFHPLAEAQSNFEKELLACFKLRRVPNKPNNRCANNKTTASNLTAAAQPQDAEDVTYELVFAENQEDHAIASAASKQVKRKYMSSAPEQAVAAALPTAPPRVNFPGYDIRQLCPTEIPNVYVFFDKAALAKEGFDRSNYLYKNFLRIAHDARMVTSCQHTNGIVMLTASYHCNSRSYKYELKIAHRSERIFGYDVFHPTEHAKIIHFDHYETNSKLHVRF
jgi:hypothetical protein